MDKRAKSSSSREYSKNVGYGQKEIYRDSKLKRDSHE